MKLKKRKVTVLEYLPSGVEIRTELFGTREKVDAKLRDICKKPGREYVRRDDGYVTRIWWR